MPQIIAPIIGAIASAAPAIAGVGSAIGIGEGIANLTGGGQTPDLSKLISQPPAPTGPTQQQVQQNAALARNAATNEAVNLGGALAPNFLQQIAGDLQPTQPGYGLLGYQQLTGGAGGSTYA